MWHTKETRQILKELKTNSRTGLTEEEAKNRLEAQGKNELKEKKKESIFVKFIKQFNDFMIITLICAAIISAIVSKATGDGDYIDSIIIIAIVIFNAIMGLVQEEKAEKSLEALKKLSAPKAMVVRNGKIKSLPSSDVVVGDIIILEAGNFVPADCRILESFDLKIEESALTGENLASNKNSNIILDKDVAIGDMKNMAFATTIVVNGRGIAVCTETGMNTKVGKIAGMIMQEENTETPIQKKLEEVGKTLAMVCMVICVFIFVIGIFKKIPIAEMFMTSVGLAVAAIPEGLPAIVTIMLSIGVTRMARKNAIIRKLPAVETLGASSVICSDKTGTLTKNKMTVVELRNAEGEMEDKSAILELLTMCTDSSDPTEIALIEAAKKENLEKETLYKNMPRINEIAFDSERKLMTTIHKVENGYRIITKGAPDVLLKRCEKYYEKGTIKSIYDKIYKIENENNKMADNALRVLAVAYKDVENLPSNINSQTVENNLTFVGLVGMIDPPRDGVKEAIRTCKRAGIKTVMITGDHLNTANAIAKQLGILNKGDLSIDGAHLEKMSQSELENNIMKYSVFARVSPDHKVRIVKAFKSKGRIVAMTGDGVNDSPALKNADIGIAMGKGGTDVAKNAADMVLTDDNFVTIVEAVKEGRTIYDNIKKAVHFLIATNIGEIVTIFMGLILGMKSPLLAIQLLWVNLVTDSLPAIAIGLEKPEKDIMNRLPRNPAKSFFADGLWSSIIIEGIMIGALTLLAFSMGNKLWGLEVGRTMAFVSIGIIELVHSLNIKSKESIFECGIFENKFIIGALVLGTFLQIVVVVIPSFAKIFSLVPLNNIQWLVTTLISISPIAIIEIQKACTHFNFKIKEKQTV